MIVDLLRNDLSRIAVPGSVAVPALFRVETYPTIHQLVSDVTARLRPGVPIGEVLRRLHPCGSITGAPKIRAMQIISAVERCPRGVYTGAIGFVGPGGEAAFNVAIRTLALRDGDACATLGLGSGIVADSIGRDEWRECLAKGDFISVAGADFDLIETMAFDPFEGVLRLDAHLARLGESARALGFAFDRHGIRNMLQHASFRQQERARVRLRLSRDGAVAILIDPMPAPPPGDAPVPVAIAPLPVAPSDIRLRHKTSDRGFYDAARAACGAFEVLFTDPAGRLTEGSFTNLFVERDGVLLTPPQALGLLPGVLRAELIAQGRAREAELTPADLTGGFYIGNALRGLIRATML
jgi:para-aminobenzoate synthetase/4-amino-4-deoxychorismate lyase